MEGDEFASTCVVIAFDEGLQQLAYKYPDPLLIIYP